LQNLKHAFIKEKSALCLFLLTAVVAGCSSDKKTKGDLPYIDSQKEYPIKELILTDIADVTYVVLNSDDKDYLYSGIGVRCVTENNIIVYDTFSGSFLFFSKDGKPKSRFNRMGRGPGEYLYVGNILYDEITDDLFVIYDSYSDAFILVYSSTGKFKRKISVPGVSMARIASFDEHSLIFYDQNYREWKLNDSPPIGGPNTLPYRPFYVEVKYDSPYFLISKTDGAIMDIIKLPEKDYLLRDTRGRSTVGRQYSVVHCPAGVFLCNPDADTVFRYNRDKSLTPVMYKIPPGSESTPKIILNNCVELGEYQFMELITLDREEEGGVSHKILFQR